MKLLIIFFAFFCAFASCWSVSSSSSGSSPLAALKQSASSLADHARIVSFWTPQKINEALANTHAGPDVELLSQAEVEAVAALLNQEPHMDEIVYPGLSTRQRQTDSENEDGEILPVSTLSPDNWLSVSYTGKVFFQNSAGVSISCTGVVVPSSYRNMLFTAPQCVYNKTSSTFHKNWAFAPGWDGAPSSFPGTFSVRNGYIPTGYASYTNSSHLLYALGILIANKKSGLELEDATLSPSVRFGGPTTAETRYLIGYSAAQTSDKQYYWSGGSLSLPLGPSTASGISAQGYNTNPPGAVQWYNFEENFGSGTVATISSFANSNYPDYSFGTYFGSNLNTFYKNVQAASGLSSSSRSRSRSRSRSKTRSKSKSRSRSKSHSKR